jgi:hypothetical protein
MERSVAHVDAMTPRRVTNAAWDALLKLLVHEAPLVIGYDIAIGVEELDAHGHRDGLLGHEEDDTLVHGVLECPALGVYEANASDPLAGVLDGSARVEAIGSQFPPRLAQGNPRGGRVPWPPLPVTPWALHPREASREATTVQCHDSIPLGPPSASHVTYEIWRSGPPLVFTMQIVFAGTRNGMDAPSGPLSLDRPATF